MLALQNPTTLVKEDGSFEDHLISATYIVSLINMERKYGGCSKISKKPTNKTTNKIQENRRVEMRIH